MKWQRASAHKSRGPFNTETDFKSLTAAIAVELVDFGVETFADPGALEL